MFSIWRDKAIKYQDITPLKFGMSQEAVTVAFGEPDTVSTMKAGGRPLILKYQDIEFHFEERTRRGLYLIYSDCETDLSITAEHIQ